MRKDTGIDAAGVDKAVKVLRGGGVILYPTDTVWGVGCDATNEKAVARVYALKRRSDAKSLVTLVSDMEMLARYVKEIPEMAATLDELSGSPLTIVYPAVFRDGLADEIAPNVTASDGSLAARIPRHPFCQALLRAFRRPVVSTSANISGRPAPSSYDEIPAEIIDGVEWCADPAYEAGATGAPSSIIAVGLHSEVKVIRR